jgi:hypothetical protein
MVARGGPHLLGYDLFIDERRDVGGILCWWHRVAAKGWSLALRGPLPGSMDNRDTF